jgi:hypothetical protein
MQGTSDVGVKLVEPPENLLDAFRRERIVSLRLGDRLELRRRNVASAPTDGDARPYIAWFEPSGPRLA